MFEAVRDERGFPAAKCTCQDCGHTERIRAGHERHKGDEPSVNEGQCIRKLTDNGWSHIRGRLRCPSCTTKRRASNAEDFPTAEVIPMTTTPTPAPLRQPTREQKRAIIDLLGEVYDTKSERYRGAETDQTVADTLGSGILWGWVSQVREELFGPDGNEEADMLLRDIAEWRKTADALAERLHGQLLEHQKTLREFNEARAKVAELAERVETRKAVGRR